VYEYLEGLIPPPSNTYIKIADIVEIEEKERINKQIGERRTRLGAKIGTVTTEVKREVFSNSPLETLYQDIIDWTTDDSIRYQYEERLLYRAFDTLGALNGPEKFKKWENVLEISRGMVILKREYQLPWNILIEWTDGESVADWDIGILKEYVELFPDSGLGKTLKGYLESEVSPFPRLRGSDEPGEAGQPIEKMSADDCLLMMTVRLFGQSHGNSS
jgi:superkiller protein 3